MTTPILPHEKTAVWLAHAGAVPFLVLTAMVFVPFKPGVALQAMTLYSLAILCFLAGSWWGFAVMTEAITPPVKARLLIASNIAVLIPVAAVLLLDPLIAIFTLGGLYVVFMYTERWLEGNQQPAWYRLMRTRVSTIAAGAHLLFGFGLMGI